MKVGDKLLCENGHIYTLADGDGFYTFTIIDEFGEEINKIHDYYLEDCLIQDEDEITSLCVGIDNNNYLKHTRVLKLIEV